MRQHFSRFRSRQDAEARFTFGYRERKQGFIGTTAALIMGGISAAGAIGGAALQSRAAGNAAKTQSAAADAAGQHVEDVTREVNPQIREAADRSISRVTTATDDAARILEEASARANAGLDPYAMLGEDAVNALAMGLKDFNKTPTMADLEIDPGFAFRLAEGQKALERSAAARGSSLGGGTLKSLARYSQGVASDEYQKAFDRYRMSTNDRFARLTALSDRGFAAATKRGDNDIRAREWAGTVRIGGQEWAGNADINAANAMTRNTIDAARAKGEYLTQGANARASGEVASGNAWASGVAGAGNSIMNALILSELAKPRGTAVLPAPAPDYKALNRTIDSIPTVPATNGMLPPPYVPPAPLRTGR